MKYSAQTEQAARTVLSEVCALKPQERLVIITNRGSGTDETELISCALYDAARALGSEAALLFQPVKSSLDYADPCVIAALQSKPDLVISISSNKLGKDSAAEARPLTHEGSLYDHIFDYLLYGTGEIRAVWTPGINIDMFERTVCIDYTALADRADRLCRLFAQAASVHISSPSGTDILIPLTRRKPMRDDGNFRERGRGGNIPAGEVFVSPALAGPECSGASGLIVFDGSLCDTEGDFLIETPVSVQIEAGLAVSVSGGREAERLLRAISQAEEGAHEKEEGGKLPPGQGAIYAKNARNLGELGIGLNPAALITGNMLEDEKTCKTCHFAIGANYDGDAPALIHLDGVVKYPTITIIAPDGSHTEALRDGELLV